MDFGLAEHTIFVCRAGSQAQGTARADSDLDLRGVCIAPLRQRVGLGAPFEQYEGGVEPLRSLLSAELAASAVPEAAVEVVVFDLHKFLRLCAQANPNALEIL